MSSYRSIQQNSGAVPDSWIEATEHDTSILLGGQILHHSTCWCKRQHICQQSGCRNTFLNQEGYCMPHYWARKPEGMFTNEERK